jgi:mono/diheme cytochrome c family protein
MRTAIIVLVTVLVLIGGSVFYAVSGIYNIAATKSHWRVTKGFIGLTKHRSIDAHKENLTIPETDPADRRQAFSHYHSMCRYCHGAPGYGSAEFSMGMYPEPPEMATGHVQEEMDDQGIFWTVTNGLKLTGMPAFGPTHTDVEIAGIVSLVRQIPHLPPRQYREAVEAMSQVESHHSTP